MLPIAFSWDTSFFNSSAFIAGLCLLEYGANSFIDNTAIVARRLGVSETLIALVTAGAEWEELAVIVATLLQHKPALGLGTVLGASISNILGAFSLGLLFHPGPATFDRNAKIYSSILFMVTSIFSIIALTNSLRRAAGVSFLVVFIVYILSIIYGIYNGTLDLPEGSDSDECFIRDDEVQAASITETSTLLGAGQTGVDDRQPRRCLKLHVFQLVLGFIALSLSGFVLSHSAMSLAADMELSDTMIGITILSFATTLPEKFLSVLSGMRGRGGIVVASTAGSNIFLMTLCIGILLVLGDGELGVEGGFVSFEILTSWASSALLLGIVVVGGRWWMGTMLSAGYVAFVVLEFTLFRR